MRDLYNNIRAIKGILAIVANNTTEGTGVGVDLLGYEGALVIFNIGTSLDTLSGSVKIQLDVQESDDNSAWSNVAAGDLLGGDDAIVIDAAAEDDVIHQRGYIGTKQYIRPLITFTGTHTNGFPVSAVVVRGLHRHAPIKSG